MSKYKHYWYGVVKRMIMSSKNLSKDDSLQAFILNKAIEEAKAETLRLPNGELRLKAVDEILIRQTKTYAGVAQEVNYDWRTIQNWVTSFVNMVGKKAGY